LKSEAGKRAFQWKDRPPNPAGALADAGAGDADGQVRLAGSRPADQHEIALLLEEGPAREVADQRLVDRRVLEAEFLDLLGEGHPRDRHLVFDRARLLLVQLGRQQVADHPLGLVLSLDRHAGGVPSARCSKRASGATETISS